MGCSVVHWLWLAGDSGILSPHWPQQGSPALELSLYFQEWENYMLQILELFKKLLIILIFSIQNMELFMRLQSIFFTHRSSRIISDIKIKKLCVISVIVSCQSLIFIKWMTINIWPVLSPYPVRVTMNVSPTCRKAEGRRLNLTIRLVWPENISTSWAVVDSISNKQSTHSWVKSERL